jgi:hypothetical protein
VLLSAKEILRTSICEFMKFRNLRGREKDSPYEKQNGSRWKAVAAVFDPTIRK